MLPGFSFLSSSSSSCSLFFVVVTMIVFCNKNKYLGSVSSFSFRVPALAVVPMAFVGQQQRHVNHKPSCYDVISSQHYFTSSSRRTSTTALSVAIDTSDIKTGLTVEIDGEPHKVINFSIMKQARGAAKTTIKFKNLVRGNTIENTYRSGEKFETALVEKVKAQFTYQEGVCRK
jgi:Elongation factor P (EF-P) KOW-like domain